MSPAEAKNLILDILSGIAPEADLRLLSGEAQLRDELDLDSMDFLNFITALHQKSKVAIPEADYPKLFTLNGAIQYLSR
jgi:acyl carrier protein